MTIDIITASAGAGKTYTLATEMLAAIKSGATRPDAIVAITYTNKAAAELGRRLRRRLLEAGMPVEAARVRDGYLGTIHSVCQRLVGDLAFEAGTSPYPEPAPESYSKRLFREVVGEVTAGVLEELGPLVEALSLETRDSSSNPYVPSSWRDALEAIVGSARENRIGETGIRASRDASVGEVLALLDPPSGAASDRDQALRAEVASVHAWTEREIATLEAQDKKVTQRAYKQRTWARKLARCIQRGQEPSWSDYAKVFSGDWSAQKVQPVIDGLRSAIVQHLSHPRLHQELEDVLVKVFDHASAVSEAFVARKQSERLLDFADMLAQAADVLRRPEARAQLEGCIDLVMVDEFQDTSPVQLEVVMALSSLAKRTVWVGDKKQAIFGFQGSDPSLMEAAAEAALQGRDPRVLDHNYRSRPSLVRFCSELFASAFERHAIPREQVVLEPACPESPALEGQPALRLWRTIKDPTNPKAKISEAAGLARQLRSLLDSKIQVREGSSDPTKVAPTRGVRAGDIAVLARKNKTCRAIASALEAQGIPARVAEQGLNQTPEAKVLRAGLALLADPRDTLAAAEIAWFTGSVPNPDEWLEQRITARSKAKEAKAADIAFPDNPALGRLRALAEQARQQTPEEALLAVYDALDLPELALSWDDPRRHFANLEALRAVARDYQDTCAARRSAATIAGLVRHLEELSNEVEQALPTTDDAVRVLTYHKSKGLEWPVVVCAALDEKMTPRHFGVRVEPATSFDATEPLKGRELRWWPSPYGRKTSRLEFRDRATNTAIAVRLGERDKAESTRLLYVGFTRARDHLILSAMASSKGAKTPWLDQLDDANDTPILDLPWTSPGQQTVTVGGKSWDVLVSEAHGRPPAQVKGISHDVSWFRRPQDRTQRAPQRIRPSSHELSDTERAQVTIEEVVSLGGRQALRARSREEMAAVGDVIHNFLAADPTGGAQGREEIVKALLQAGRLDGQIAAQTVIDMADRFHRWLDGHAPGTRLPEWPVRWVRGDGQVLMGDIDLLVPYGDGWLLLDHKSFPGDTAGRDEKVRKWAGQLAAYRGAVEKATGKPVVEIWVHLPVRGEVVRVGGV